MTTSCARAQSPSPGTIAVVAAWNLVTYWALWVAVTEVVGLNGELDLRVADATVELGLAYPVLIFLVLLHSGKDAGMSGAFGVGVAGGTTGGSLMERNLDRWTIFLAVLFAANTIALLKI